MVTHKINWPYKEIQWKEIHAVFLDFSKAFDGVWYEGLIYKLKCNEKSDEFLALLQSFLHVRREGIVLNLGSLQGVTDRVWYGGLIYIKIEI